jgi:hypothetical protein
MRGSKILNCCYRMAVGAALIGFTLASAAKNIVNATEGGNSTWNRSSLAKLNMRESTTRDPFIDLYERRSTPGFVPALARMLLQKDNGLM